MKKYELKINFNEQKGIDYLQKCKLTQSKQNIGGCILSFFIKIKNGNQTDLISLLLFLDFRTGRVERYLINSSNKDLIKKGVDYKEDWYFFWNNEKYKIFHENEHIINTEFTSLSRLNDGQLTRTFYINFMSELLRDYLQFNNSFLDGNMASLKKLTSPLKDSEYEEVTDPKKIEEAKLSKKLYIGTNKDNEGK